jgi:putative ABC transport system permease protein
VRYRASARRPFLRGLRDQGRRLSRAPGLDQAGSGLLRAVGMKRRQVRTMIRSEAVILAIFGALIGIIIGTGMGIALVSSLKQQGITDTVVPASSLVVFLGLAALLGLLAATWPARRAARLDVLAAIAAQ